MDAPLWTHRAAYALLLPALLALGACGDDGITPPVGTELNAEAVAASFEQVMDSTALQGEAFQSLELASAALGDAGTGASLAPAGVRPALAAGLDRVHAVAAPAPSAAVIPESQWGTTYVFNPDSARYVASDTATGAPENGVRIIYYAIDPVTDEPAEPLNPLGYVDLTDETVDETSGRLGIEIVQTSGDAAVTLVDYFIDVDFDETTSGATVTQLADGFVSDAENTAVFTLERSVTLTEGSDTVDFGVDYALALEGTEKSVEFVAGGTAVAGEPQPVSVGGTLTVGYAGGSVVLEFGVEGDVIDGAISHNGTTVALLSGDADDPTVTAPDGMELTSGQKAALRSLGRKLWHVFWFTHEVFHPLGG